MCGWTGNGSSECLGRHRAITFREEHERPPLQAPQSPYFVTLQGVCAGAALLAPAHTQGASIEIDLRPLQVAARHDHHSEYDEPYGLELALFGGAAIVLLVVAWTFGASVR
jgi:hypothetical protein